MTTFTHVCEKVNISLLGDTLTLYVKENGEGHYSEDDSSEDLENSSNYNSENDSETRLIWIPHYYVEDDHPIFVNPGPLDDLGLERFPKETEEGHEQYHQDQFDPRSEHYHIKFDATITKEKFSQILQVFVTHTIISDSEKIILDRDYHHFSLQRQEPSEFKWNSQPEMPEYKIPLESLIHHSVFMPEEKSAPSIFEQLTDTHLSDIKEEGDALRRVRARTQPSDSSEIQHQIDEAKSPHPYVG